MAKKKRKKIIYFSILSFVIILFSIGGYFFFDYVLSGLPSFEQLENPKPQLASKVYSSDGELIGSFYRQNRIYTPIDSIPKNLINALIATEDRKFYEHWGVDLVRFGKAMIKNIFLFRREGASTITQQLAKNLFELKYRKETLFDTIVRKLREWITAVELEKSYTKDEILEMYLNIAYFGRGAHGVGVAAKVYFGKDVSKLTIPESAVLVALLKSPYRYNPFRNYNTSLQRRNLVMYNMYEVGMISKEEYEKLKAEPIDISENGIAEGASSKIAPHFVEYVRQQLVKMSKHYGFDIYEDGLTITTTLDTRMQKIANKAVKEHLDGFQKLFDKRWKWREHRDILDDILTKAIVRRKEYKQAKTSAEKEKILNSLKNNIAFVDSVEKDAQTIDVGFVVLDVKTGEIRAMVGGRDKFKYGLNHVTQIKRQPGSAFKTIVYTVAIDNGLYPAYPLLDQPFDYNGWAPKNFEEETGGFTTLRQALAHSINLVSARLIIEGYVPLWKVRIYAEKMGIKSRLHLVPSIVLGTSEVTPLELTSAYATLANKGIYNEPFSILKIEDKDGILIDNFTPVSHETLSEATAYIMTNMLESVINEGTGIRTRVIHNFHRPAAGKTGTTQDYSDAWFIGYTPQLAAGVWVGFDDQRIKFTGSYGQGARAANPIWSNFMRETYDSLDLPLEYFEPPANGDVVTVSFCKESIFELGTPRLYSDDCKSGKYRDIINIKDIPPLFNAERDTTIKIFTKYSIPDSNAHEAVEIPPDSL